MQLNKNEQRRLLQQWVIWQSRLQEEKDKTCDLFELESRILEYEEGSGAQAEVECAQDEERLDLGDGEEEERWYAGQEEAGAEVEEGGGEGCAEDSAAWGWWWIGEGIESVEAIVSECASRAWVGAIWWDLFEIE